MKADLSRKTFDPLNHFSRVLMQQGRVQLDADWNEQAAILLHLIRRLAANALGPVAAVGSGFEIAALPTTVTTVANDVVIEPGDMYVDGILCEVAATPVAILKWSATIIYVARWTVDRMSYATGQYLVLTDDSNPQVMPVVSQITAVNYARMSLTMDQDFTNTGLAQATEGRARRLTTYLTQPDLPNPLPALSGSQQLYLDVWERLVTAVECDDIREVALNGADTAARTRVVWQVKALPPGNQACLSQQQLIDQLQPWDRGYLRARIQPAQGSTDPCTISPTSSYRGPENQLYRVEIHTGGTATAGVTSGPPTFKWSRENGAVVFPILSLAASGGQTTVTLASLGRDDRFGLALGDYVEAQDDAMVLSGTPGPLLQVQSIDPASLTVVLSGGTVPFTIGAQGVGHPLLRRWDQTSGDPSQGGIKLAADNAVPIPPIGSTPTWIELEDGVQILFDGPPTPTYTSGDYWLIPARVATGNVIWPSETATDAQGNSVTNPVAKPPDGIDHHYAPLAIVATSANAVPNVTLCYGKVRPYAQP